MAGAVEETLQLLTVSSPQDGPKKLMTMRDQDQVVQELKKENFDLKLRLYMQEKNSENNEGKVSEYEEQLGAILGKFEEQQKIFEAQARELAEAKHKEKMMLKRQRNLESECQLRDEKIANLSMSLSQLSTSMTNVSSPRHYAPARNTRSMYFPDTDDEEEDEEEDGVRATDNYSPHHTPRVSRVAPMSHMDTSTPLQYHDEMRLMDNKNNNNNNNINNRPGRSSYESTTSDPTHRLTKNYYNTTINNQRTRADGGFDNIGVVKPNNSRTVVDVEIPQHNQQQQQQTPEQPKKKRKGLFNVLKLCSGKSSSKHRPPTREDSMYHKRPTQVARVTMQQQQQQQYNSLPANE